ncbi:hypothetical protein SynMITS9220_02696 [Synechococcus sp. MIT S9220]|nr:hypothetical protein SynMITS9220_02696 [Synechococcus sp. MIT S9220]
MVEGRDQDLLDALRSLAEEKRQPRVTHAHRVVQRFGLTDQDKSRCRLLLCLDEKTGSNCPPIEVLFIGQGSLVI